MEDNIIVGLDIGTTKICCIVGKKNEYGKLEILGMGNAVSEGVSMGEVMNIEKTVRSINKAVDEASQQSGIDIKVVNVGIAGKHIRSTMEHAYVTRENPDDEIGVQDVAHLAGDIHRMVTPPGSQIIHVMPQKYIVDYEELVTDPVGMTGVKLEADFHVITAKANAIRNINRCIQRCGLEIAELILEPLASSLSVLSEEEIEAGVCLVDIGGGTTDVAIFHEKMIRHTAVIPFGGNIITADIKQGCLVMEHQAELLKTKFGRAIAEDASPNEVVSIPGLRNRAPKEISIKNLANIIEARMEEIIELVHTEIITSGLNRKLAAGIVITGGGSQLTNLSQLFEYMTGLDARIGYPNEHLGKSKVSNAKSPVFATSVGLVLSGFKALDEREERYNELTRETGSVHEETSKKKVTKPFSGKTSFFTSILEKTKGLLIDDFDDKD